MVVELSNLQCENKTLLMEGLTTSDNHDFGMEYTWIEQIFIAVKNYDEIWISTHRLSEM